MAAAHITGLAVAVIDRDNIAFLKGFGTRDDANHTALADTTPMSAGTLVQPMVATLVMELVSHKSIDLDAPIERYIGTSLDGPFAAVAQDARYHRITTRMLLDRMSGIKRGSTPSDSTLHIATDPGTEFSMDDAGFDLLAHVVEHTAKAPLDRVIHERLLAPLGMTQTRVVRNAAVRTAISAVTTPRDMARFIQGVLGGRGVHLDIPHRVEMLKPQAGRRVARMKDSAGKATGEQLRFSYGLGWGVFMSPYGPAFFGMAEREGESYYVVAFDDPKAAVILMSDTTNARRVFPTLLNGLMRDVFSPAVIEEIGKSR